MYFTDSRAERKTNFADKGPPQVLTITLLLHVANKSFVAVLCRYDLYL